MNIENRIEDADLATMPETSDLLQNTLQCLAPFHAKLTELDEAIETIAEVGDRTAGKGARKLQRQLRKVEPSITMIGQVKAGKTSLVNAMVGWPDLLPADVNPWTSVVTSLHVSSKMQTSGNSASFSFFEAEEWERLLERGGRIGELAGRAGADEELEKLAVQLDEMRAKSKARLGDKFEMLLGQEHKYGYVDQELVERYVCLGDTFDADLDPTSKQGRFADITKSADLYLKREEFPLDMCIRDTPGVNDTFMMREQITIRAIRESRICVVVLSAHQALTTVDLALIRLIANLPSREVLIFVNRIDELADPAQQIPEIHDSILETLAEHHGPEDAQIIFGSAYWANHVVRNDGTPQSDASLSALKNWAGAQGHEDEAKINGENHELVWELSGVPELYKALADRIESGIGGEAINRAAKGAMNLVSGITTSEHIVADRPVNSTLEPLDHAAIPTELDKIEERAVQQLDEKFTDITKEFFTRLERSHKGFLDRATGSLIRHLEEHGEKTVWQYDATGLRVLLRTAFQVYSRNAQALNQELFLQTAAEIREVYLRAFNVPEDQFQLEAPPAPYVPSPVLLGQTIALDLKGGLWSRWWHRRRGYRNFAVEFADLIKAETDPIVTGLKGEHARQVVEDSQEALKEFVAGQREMLASLTEQAETTASDLMNAGKTADNREKTLALAATTETLTRFAA
ncbi:MAG: hypothetical protein HKO95_14540 [Rhodobacteraceae bacterium]|nr:hypothetical protein [Paracoccaceae bacterium]